MDEEDYEGMMKRKEREKNRQKIIDEVIAVPKWVQERDDREREELERKRKEELGEYVDEKPSLTKLSDGAAQLLFSFGLEGSRRDNVGYLAEDLLLHTCGNAVHFLKISTKEQTFLKSKSGRGIGAVAIHPQKHCFAVCEQGKDPDIFIYAYPSLKEKKVMKNGTERVFTASNFNSDGTRLATVGGHPDYWLTVWDWEKETMLLRSKAFSQEVFKVNFSKYFPGQHITSGVGHIRFWKMASTFTGLKLEGAIAKFGTVSISAVAGYVELRNSKVNSLDRAWQSPKGQAAKLIDARARNEYAIQKPGEEKRHLLSVVGIASNGWIKRLYTVTGQYWEEDGDKYKASLEKAVSSFQFV